MDLKKNNKQSRYKLHFSDIIVLFDFTYKTYSFIYFLGLGLFLLNNM